MLGVGHCIAGRDVKTRAAPRSLCEKHIWKRSDLNTKHNEHVSECVISFCVQWVVLCILLCPGWAFVSASPLRCGCAASARCLARRVPALSRGWRRLICTAD